MKFISNYISNLDIFFIDFILLCVYFFFHYFYYFENFNNIRKIVFNYKKYKLCNKLIINFIISFLISNFLVLFVNCKLTTFWDLFISPTIGFLFIAAIDNYRLSKYEFEEFKNISAKNKINYKKYVKKFAEVQKTQQKLISVHDQELYELKRNINIIKDMVELEYGNVDQDENNSS